MDKETQTSLPPFFKPTEKDPLARVLVLAGNETSAIRLNDGESEKNYFFLDLAFLATDFLAAFFFLAIVVMFVVGLEGND
jgi:hypothetical protein